MDSSLRERFARLGPIRDTGRVPSGSPAIFVLRLPEGRGTAQPIDAMLALARRGLSMLRAKRAIEALMADGRFFVELPMVEDVLAVVADLAACGVSCALVTPAQSPDVRKLREGLRLTREQFAVRYGLEVETVRNWEIGKREPDTTARSYLRVIARDPEHVADAYAEAASGV